MEDTRYFDRLAAAYVRGMGISGSTEEQTSLDGLSQQEISLILEQGKAAGLKLYPFKATHSDLPRVKKVLGFLKGIAFESLLDVGSGRGVFLLPFLTDFPWVRVTSLDILPHRVAFLQALARGGVENLTVLEADLCTQPLPENSVDVVTLLEVLEHIPNVAAAVQAAVTMARKFVVVTVPSKEDDNPEHIHLLTKDVLTELFQAAGCSRLRFDGVNGHLVLVASVRNQGGNL